MISFTTGNLLDSPAEAIVNTVNTVGIMGKGIALMFKEAFPANFKSYAQACKEKQVSTGKMFVTEGPRFAGGPKWIINFPTKQHWRSKTKIEWISDGLDDLVQVIEALEINSIALPPLGCGNGGLEWSVVKPLIVKKLEVLENVDVTVFEPTARYQNVAKPQGVKKLTPPRALIAELIRRYSILGIQCTHLEVQKLAWFLEKGMETAGYDDVLNLRFEANRYGPYADRLRHLLNALDGSYLVADIRIPDAKPTDVVSFNVSQKQYVQTYLKSESSKYLPVLDRVSGLIDGFESPLGLELLATVDWLTSKEGVERRVDRVREALAEWMGGGTPAERKLKLFTPRMIELALKRLEVA